MGKVKVARRGHVSRRPGFREEAAAGWRAGAMVTELAWDSRPRPAFCLLPRSARGRRALKRPFSRVKMRPQVLAEVDNGSGAAGRWLSPSEDFCFVLFKQQNFIILINPLS